MREILSKAVDFFVGRDLTDSNNLFVFTQEQIENQCRREQGQNFRFFEGLIVGGVGVGAGFGQALLGYLNLAAGAVAPPSLIIILLGGTGLSAYVSKDAYYSCKKRLSDEAYQLADSKKVRKLITVMGADTLPEPVCKFGKYCKWATNVKYGRIVFKFLGKCVDQV